MDGAEALLFDYWYKLCYDKSSDKLRWDKIVILYESESEYSKKEKKKHLSNFQKLMLKIQQSWVRRKGNR